MRQDKAKWTPKIDTPVTDMTENELAWLRFLRDIGNGRDPEVTLRRVQLLRRVCERRRR
jgi:hypothetical protein